MTRLHTLTAVCPTCHQPRELRLHRPWEIPGLLARQCKACFVKEATTLPPLKGAGEPDWEVVQRLLDGVPVRSWPADRRAAVQYLTARGLTAQQISDRLRISKRTVVRWRRSVREVA